MFAKISADENSDYVEIQVNEDGSLSISEVRKHFSKCVGLRFRCKTTGKLRGTRISGDQLLLPLGVSWDNNIFHCVNEDKQNHLKETIGTIEYSLSEKFQLDTFDMIALGLPDNITDDSFFRYFSKFGKLKMCELRKNLRRPKSKGYGFLRYINFSDQNECIKTEHIINDVVVTLRLPTAKMDSSTCRRKLFVTNITPSVTLDDILEYFSVFGKIIDVFMPPASSPYAFLTFDSEDAVLKIFRFGDSHRVFGGYVVVEKVYTKQELQQIHASKSQYDEQEIFKENNSYLQEDNESYNDDNYSYSREQICTDRNEQSTNYHHENTSNDIHQYQQYHDQYDYEQHNYEQPYQDSSSDHYYQSQQYSDQSYYSNSHSQCHSNSQSETLNPQLVQNNQYNQESFDYESGYDEENLYYQDNQNYQMEYQSFDNQFYNDQAYSNQPMINRPITKQPITNQSNVNINQNLQCNLSMLNGIDKSFTKQFISDIAKRIIEQTSSTTENDVLLQLLVGQLTTQQSNFDAISTNKIETEKVYRALKLLQNPNVLDTLIRMSENKNGE